jgi:hypothetical protein
VIENADGDLSVLKKCDAFVKEIAGAAIYKVYHLK